MARVTVEDCLENVESRFALVIKATARARAIAMGAEPLVAWENDKPTVVALREIAEGLEASAPRSEEEVLMDAFVDAEEGAAGPVDESPTTASTGWQAPTPVER